MKAVNLIKFAIKKDCGRGALVFKTKVGRVEKCYC